MMRWLVMSGLLLGMAGSVTAAQIVGVRSWAGADSTRLVLELDGQSEYRVSEASTPGRLIITLPEAKTRLEAPRWPARTGFVEAVRLDVSGRVPQLVMDLNREAEAKVFLLGPNQSYGHRLVIDLLPRQANTVIPVQAAAPAPTAQPSPAMAAAVPAPPPVLAPRPAPVRKPVSKSGRNIVVTLDAGHGGEDPGAIGKTGMYEKHVTLAIARAVAQYLNDQEGVTARLTRDADFFVPLQRRRQIARYDHKADIFVSIHADSAPNRSAHGASVFALSLQGANSATSRFAQQLAEQENKSDLIGGVVAESDDITGVLAGMLIEGTLKHSLEMGQLILGEMKPVVGKLHSPRVEQAGFAVLKEPGMVSLLVETGFISNPQEESRLINPAYQLEVARAIAEGIVRFCQQYPVPGTRFDTSGG